MRRLVLVLLSVAVLALAGCSSSSGGLLPAPGPGQAKVDVATPALRATKASLKIENCPPAGPGGASKLPSLTLPCLGGGRDVDLSSLHGPMLVNFWSSTCTFCKREMPVLQSFYDKYGDQVPVLGVDFLDVVPQAALELAGRTGVRYPSVADPGGDLQGLSPFPVVRGLPYLAVIDADGTIVHQKFGPAESVDELVELSNTYLGTDL